MSSKRNLAMKERCRRIARDEVALRVRPRHGILPRHWPPRAEDLVPRDAFGRTSRRTMDAMSEAIQLAWEEIAVPALARYRDRQAREAADREYHTRAQALVDAAARAGVLSPGARATVVGTDDGPYAVEINGRLWRPEPAETDL